MGQTRGFTVWELVVVLAVVGLVTGAAAVAIQGHMEAARGAQVRQELESLRGAVEAYTRATGSFPATLTRLQPTFLPPAFPAVNPWGYRYEVLPDPGGQMAYLRTQVPPNVDPTGGLALAWRSGAFVLVGVPRPQEAAGLRFEQRRVQGY